VDQSGLPWRGARLPSKTGAGITHHFRLDEATRDRIRDTVSYSPYRDASAFIRAAIAQLLALEADRPSGWTVRR
jgi:hypothetical protein